MKGTSGYSGLLTLLILAGVFPGCTGDSLEGTIVFQSSRDGNFEIYAMAADGSSQRRLTFSPANDILPRWSPDGRNITFASDRDGNWEIYAMRADGSMQQRLTHGEGSNTSPFWSPDGRKIYFISTRDVINGEIYRMDPDGSGAERMTNDSTVKDRPVISRRGPHVVYVINDRGRYSLAVFEPDRGPSTPITPAQFNSVDPSFDHDGVKVLFTADRDGAPEVYEVARNGGELKRLTFDGTGARTPCATSSEHHILISEKGSIYMYSLQERAKKMLSYKGDSAPDWFPR